MLLSTWSDLEAERGQCGAQHELCIVTVNGGVLLANSAPNTVAGPQLVSLHERCRHSFVGVVGVDRHSTNEVRTPKKGRSAPHSPANLFAIRVHRVTFRFGETGMPQNRSRLLGACRVSHAWSGYHDYYSHESPDNTKTGYGSGWEAQTPKKEGPAPRLTREPVREESGPCDLTASGRRVCL